MKNKTPALWLALQFPHLGLDLQTRGHDPGRSLPFAVHDNGARVQRILDCNPAAQHAGVQAGLPVNAALGLCEDLQLAARTPAAEDEALQGLASWCYQYSGEVVVQTSEATVLLEIGASRKLFGEPEALTRDICRQLQQLGYHVRGGTAPVPLAAHLAARHALHISPAHSIRSQIGALPLESLPLGTPQDRATLIPVLQKMGFRRISEILRLPRKALARRIGIAAVDQLDRLTGVRPDPQTAWQPAEHFSTGMDLTTGISGSQALLFPLRRLVSEMCGVLRASDRGVQSLTIDLRLDRGQHQQLSLGMQQPVRNEQHILLLLRERLERLRLTSPVVHISLEAEHLLPFDAQPDSLFRDHPDLAEQPVDGLLERLQARLGKQAVHGVRGVEDHRPEYSWRKRKPNEPADCHAMPHRPVWLFAQPQPCRIEQYHMLAGPERIEAGWWDGHDCRRDYFVVRDRAGSTLWAFHEYKPHPGWYLQGLFA